MSLGAKPGPTVTRSPRRVGEVPCKPTGVLRADARCTGDALRRELAYECRESVYVFYLAVETPQAHPSLREDYVQEGRKQQRICSWPDGDMVVGHRRRLGAPRINDNDAPAAIANSAQTPLHVRGRHEATVRHDRVCAKNQKVISAVEVRDRYEGEMPEHAKRGEHLRQLIDRACRIHVLRLKRPRKRQRMGHQSEVVRHGIAVVHRDRVTPVRVACTDQAVGRAIQRVFPRGLAPARPFADHGGADAIGVVVEVREGCRLRTDVPAAERVVFVAADRPDMLAVCFDENPARCFAERAGRSLHHEDVLHSFFYRERCHLNATGILTQISGETEPQREIDQPARSG